MRILVDADACPVREIIEKVAQESGITVIMYVDSNHMILPKYAVVKTVAQGKDAVDLALINDCVSGDVVVTQDFGVASLALGKGGYAIGNSGLIYDSGNIDKLMFERFLKQKVRRAGKKGGKTANQKKRIHDDDVRFEMNLRKLCCGGNL